MAVCFMFPIVIVLAVGLAIAFERWFHLKRVKDENKKTWDSIHQVLAKGEFDEARELVNKTRRHGADAWDGTCAPGCGQTAGRHRDRHGREHDGDNPSTEKRTQYLALLSISPLFRTARATIMGLIDAFHGSCRCKPGPEGIPARASIRSAMNCTAFGLMSAIPLLLLHARMTTATGNIVNSLEMAMVKTSHHFDFQQAPIRETSNIDQRQYGRSGSCPDDGVTGQRQNPSIRTSCAC